MQEMTQQVSATSSWRRGYLIKFPSERTALIRPISIAMLLTDKRVPNELMEIVEQWVDRMPDQTTEAGRQEASDQLGGRSGLVRSNRKWMEAYAFAAMVEPRLSESPTGPNEISPLDMDDADLDFLYKFLGRPASEIAKFSRAQQEGNLESLYDVEGFFSPAEQPVGSESGSE